MEHQVLEVETRTLGKKGAARKLRASGRVPAVLYGHQETPMHISFDPRVMSKGIRHNGRNTVFKLTGLSREVLALLKDAQVHPLRRNLVHVDLIEVREGDSVTVEIPLVFTGKPKGAVLGGQLEIARRTIRLAVSPLAIPLKVVVDLTPLDIGDNLHVSDLPLPEGATPVDDGRLAVCAIKAPRSEEKTTDDEAETAEAVVAAPAAT